MRTRNQSSRSSGAGRQARSSPAHHTAVVSGGQWTVPGTNALPTGSKFYVWSDYGYVGEIAVTP